MQCENEYCVFWNDDYCSLDYASLDRRGICKFCRLISIDEEMLNSVRRGMLKNIEETHAITLKHFREIFEQNNRCDENIPEKPKKRIDKKISKAFADLKNRNDGKI